MDAEDLISSTVAARSRWAMGTGTTPAPGSCTKRARPVATSQPILPRNAAPQNCARSYAAVAQRLGLDRRTVRAKVDPDLLAEL